MVRYSLVASLVAFMMVLVLACGDDDNARVVPAPTATATATATPLPTSTPTNPKEQACLDSGGQVTTVECTCTSRQDFFNTCALGACTCPPGESRELQSCACGNGRCFDGTACVARTQG